MTWNHAQSLYLQATKQSSNSVSQTSHQTGRTALGCSQPCRTDEAVHTSKLIPRNDCLDCRDMPYLLGLPPPCWRSQAAGWMQQWPRAKPMKRNRRCQIFLSSYISFRHAASCSDNIAPKTSKRWNGKFANPRVVTYCDVILRLLSDGAIRNTELLP